MNSNVEGTIAAVQNAHETLVTMMPSFLVDRRLSANRVLVAVASMLLLDAWACSYAFAQAPVDRMDQIVGSYSDSHQFMGSVLVAQGDKVVFEKSYGDANLEWNIPDDSLTKFRIGSMTKQFTAASILLLEERGKLSTDDYLKKYMPDAPAAWNKITIYNLLTHTSGIPSFTSFPDYRTSEATPTTPKALVDRFRDKPLEFQPGEKWNYSNSGYVLLGYLLEKISGQTYPDFVTENIFKPLGMKDSGYDSNSPVILHRASGYSPSPNGPVNSGYIDMTVPFSAGALYSTTHDLLIWEQALYGGKVLSAASVKKMTTPYKENYGCGLMITSPKGHLQYEHGGVIVLANLNGGAPGDIAGKLAAVVHGEKVMLQSERKEIKVPHEILAKYVGSYELAPSIFITMSLDGDQFFTQLTGQPKFEVFAETEKDFFLKVVDAQLTFEMDGQGKVTDLVLHQNGRDQTAKRTNAPSAQSSGPFEGKWVFNAGKSNFSPGPFPKSETLTFANGTTTVEGVNGQGQSFLFSFTPVLGQAVHVNGGGDLTVETKESGTTVEHTWSDSSGTSHGIGVISTDGKTMRYELTGARWGNPVHEVSVFEKQ